VGVARGHRRRGRGGGAGGLTRAGARKCERDGVRGGVHARQATVAGGQGWGRDGASRWCMAEPGSSPWAAASTAPAVGWRERDGVHGGVFRATENVGPPPLVDRARDPHGHGGVTAARPS
jgi:hypothetical protein